MLARWPAPSDFAPCRASLPDLRSGYTEGPDDQAVARDNKTRNTGRASVSRCVSAGLALRCRRGQARHVRHATQGDLDQVEALLAELRKAPGLRERKRGCFSRESRAFLHFHADDAGDSYVDVRLDGAFQRVRVTSLEEQADFLARVQKALQHTDPTTRSVG